jgi:hypothetical protein
MRKRFGILFPVALIAILGVVCLIFLHPQETVYQGKQFAFWLDRYCWNFRDESSNGIRERNQAEAAMRQIGTNGIPVLLEMIRARNSHWREKANTLTLRVGEAERCSSRGHHRRRESRSSFGPWAYGLP